jgi:aspartate/methionine/tyrosine aminotransferase
MEKLFQKKGISSDAAKHLNPNVFKLAHHTLRETDVLPAQARADAAGRLVIPSQLGDPVVHGLYAFDPFMRYLAEEFCNPKKLKYNDSCGYPELRNVLADGNMEFGTTGYRLPRERVIVEAGISGAVRSMMAVLINKGNGDEVVIPKWSYTLYLAEAELAEAKVRNVELNSRGVVDLGHLRDSITEKTKAVFITTMGNPLGVAISNETFRDIIGIVNAKEKEFNHPIYLVADIIYEGFREAKPLDPILLSMEAGRIGPTIELYSISKLMASPGIRLGWMRIYHGGESFTEEVHAFTQACSILLQPGLGAASTPAQIALFRTYDELANSAKRELFDTYINERRAEVRRRVHSIYDGLQKIDGLVFPEFYYDGSHKLDYAALNTFYILVGISDSLIKRGELSHARQMADFQLDNGTPAVVIAVPGDHFLADEYRNQGQEYFRLVALFDETRDPAIESIRRFVQSLKS